MLFRLSLVIFFFSSFVTWMFLLSFFQRSICCSPFTSKTRKNKKLQINLALNYGSKDELLHAFNKLKNNKKKITTRDIKNLIYKISELELLLKKNINNSINLVNDFILDQAST